MRQTAPSIQVSTITNDKRLQTTSLDCLRQPVQEVLDEQNENELMRRNVYTSNRIFCE